MPREESTTTTKTARRSASTKTSKEGKAKRAPSAYNVFMGENLKKYKEEHPGIPHKEAFTAVAAKWADAPENPNRGKSKDEIKDEKEKKKKNEKKSKKDEDGDKKSTSAASDAEEVDGKDD